MSTVKRTILIAGGTGLVGSHLIKRIDQTKFNIAVLTRNPSSVKDNIRYIQWDIRNKWVSEPVEAEFIINLAGSGIADKRWTDKRKKELIQSRTESTATIEQMLKTSGFRPKMYLSASAVGYYGNRGDKVLTETSTPGTEFLSECSILWEKSALRLTELCDRITIFRIGIVLSTQGGALPKLLMTTKFGFLSYFGSGNQFYPWIHLDDLSSMFIHAIENTTVKGIYNSVSPSPITNKDLVVSIKNLINHPCLIIPAPAFALKLMLGEMAHVILNSNRVISEKISETGFIFKYSEIEMAIKDLLKRKI